MSASRLAFSFAVLLAHSVGAAESGNAPGPAIFDGMPRPDASLAEELRPFLNTRSARFLDWVDDETVLIRTRFGSTSQLHTVKGPGSARTQLTFFDEPVFFARSRGDQIAFLKDSGGNEQYQVHLVGRPAPITDPNARHDRPLLAASGKRIAFMGNGRNRVNWDIYVAVAPLWEPRRLLETKAGYWYPLDFSSDEKQLLLQQYISINESRLFLFHLDSAELKPVDLGTEPVGVSAAQFDRFGPGLLVIADLGSEYRELWRMDAQGQQRESMTDYISFDIERFAQSADGIQLAFSSNEGGLNRISIIDRREGLELDVPSLPVGVVDHLAFSPNDRQIALSLQGAVTPGDVFILDLESPDQWIPWTRSEVGGLSTDDWVEPRIVTFPAGDGLEIPAFLYQPNSPGPHPVLVDIHGGPEGQFKPRFRADLQYYVSRLGMTVIAPNVRGSSGYGKTYLRMDNGMGRMGSVRDIGALLDWIEGNKELDQDRVVVAGGSYGGFMVLASLVEYPGRLLAGIDRVGISNFVTFLKNTSPYRQDQRRAEYGDERDPAMRGFLLRVSPLTNAHRINVPLLVVQGANDPRVPQSESEQLVGKVRSAGGLVWYLLFTNEGHGIQKKENQLVYYQTVVSFLRQVLEE